MPSTSGTYNFQSIEVELIIREAFENIGISGEFVESQKLDSARRSVDFLLSEWVSKSVALWTLELDYLPLNTSRGQYILPDYVNDIVQVNLRTYTRQLNGTPRSNTGSSYDGAGGGVVANAFDGNPLTACTQTVTNGNISYDYGADVTQQINFIGIQSNTTTAYTILIEYSQDTTSWTLLQAAPVQTYATGITVWFDIVLPVPARAYRIRETGGQTLNIQEIYFTNNTFDFAISNVSRYEYLTYPNKQLEGRPNVYYLDRQINPVLNIWPVPSSLYNCLQYSYKEEVQDVGAYTNALQIPARFYPAMVLGLSWKLAVKYNPQMAQVLKADYNEAFRFATDQDSENTPITIRGDENYEYSR